MVELTAEQKAMCDISYLTKRKKEKNDQPERILQRNICDHLQTHYPDVYFFSDPSGLKLSPNILKLLKATRSAHSQLDIVILEPFTMKATMKSYSGLILEVKASPPFKENGELLKNEHLQEQKYVMDLLEQKGFLCRFTWSMDYSIRMFEMCFGKPKTDSNPLFP